MSSAAKRVSPAVLQPLKEALTLAFWYKPDLRAFLQTANGNRDLIAQLDWTTYKRIAVDLVWAVQQSVTIDCSLKHSVRAAMRLKIRRLLAKYDYPPDREEEAVELVLQQAELLAAETSGVSE